jgi:glycosyltransferase involved in cell wall biosynthesis
LHAVEEAILPTLLVARLFDLSVLYDMQSSLPEQLEDVRFLRLKSVQAILRRVERWMIRRADAVACSVGLKGHVSRIAPNIPVMEWHYPVGEPASGESQAVHSHDALEELGLPKDRFLIAYAGNFASYQGIERLVRAIPMVLKRVPNAFFLFIGAEQGEALPGMSADHLSMRNLRVLTRRPQADMFRILSSADVLVSPRDVTFNLPLKVLDYLAVGKPIVATDSPAHRKLLTDESALLVDCESSALADAIVRIFEEPGLGRAIAGAAQQIAVDKLGWETFTQEIDSLYSSLAARPSKVS